jgi:hypothetical protein
MFHRGSQTIVHHISLGALGSTITGSSPGQFLRYADVEGGATRRRGGRSARSRHCCDALEDDLKPSTILGVGRGGDGLGVFREKKALIPYQIV